MRVILRGITGDPGLNGRVGHVGGIEGDRVFVRLDGARTVRTTAAAS
jgi:hypothetical protein